VVRTEIKRQKTAVRSVEEGSAEIMRQGNGEIYRHGERGKRWLES
jgi:hypothetical protein